MPGPGHATGGAGLVLEGGGLVASKRIGVEIDVEAVLRSARPDHEPTTADPRATVSRP